MTRQTFLLDYWDYYLMLEKKFMHTFNYVELNDKNKCTFSNEFASLIQLIGAELDCFFKEYCGFPPEAEKTISCYANYILPRYSGIRTQQVIVYGISKTLKPFESWDEKRAKKSLTWWAAFDSVKHSRVFAKADACQFNTLNILAALYLMEMKYLSLITGNTNEPDIPDKQSMLFSLKEWPYRYWMLEKTLGEIIE